MATLAKDTPRAFENTGGHPDYNEVPIIADDIVYAGAAVGESTTTGTGRPLVGGDGFMGFAIEKCDNAGGAAAAKRIKVLNSGVAWLTVTGGDNINDYDAPVYAVDDNTFTLTASGATAIGKLKRYDASGKCLVYFESTAKTSR
jgi:hypothetical protein